MSEKKRRCIRCTGKKILSLGNKVYECEECGYIFKEYDDSEDVMLRIAEFTPDGHNTDTRLCECMSLGEPKLGRLRTFGVGKLHMTVDNVTPNEVTLTFHYRDITKNRTVTVVRDIPYEFEENGLNYSFSICGDE